MRIGIVTVYTNINYGSVLQSYALQTVLKRLGAERVENILVQKDINRTRTINKIMLKTKFLLRKLFPAKDPARVGATLLSREFAAFRTNYISESKYSPSQIKERNRNGIEDYDYYVCGSDQIWAPNQFHKEFFLDFVRDKSKKISYATSIGLPKIPDDLVSTYRTLIGDMGKVSMREKEGALLVEQITGLKEIPVVLDPTLLLERHEWIGLSKKREIEGKYILVLLLGKDERHREWIKQFSSVTGCKIVTLPLRPWDNLFGDVQCFDAGPQQFLSLVDKADYVCTDSFHGMAFSINFNKDFFGFMRFSEEDPICQNSRVRNLLNMVDLNNRLVTDYSREIVEYLQLPPIEYEQVNLRLAEMRKSSIDYLISALNLKQC